MTAYHVFRAKYAGKCAVCGDEIKPGDPVFYDADDQLTHEGCDE